MFYIWVQDHETRSETFYTPGSTGSPRLFTTREEAELFVASDHPARVPAHRATYTVHEGDPLQHGRTPAAIDWSKPIELEDGTPCERVDGTPDADVSVRVRLLADPTGHFPYRTVAAAGSLLFDSLTGELAAASDPTFIRVRNMADHSRPSLPAWKAKAILQDRQRPLDMAVPWKGAEWHKGEPAEVHFPHLALEGDVPMVAFYASEQHAERERLTKMRPGRYLKRYFGETLDNEEIERLTAEVAVQAGAMAVRWTQDADEIETIYVNGPSSCMSEHADHYAGHCHPSRVYAGPDLAVAWLGDIDDATARCVIWPERKEYGPIYPYCSRMRLLLEQQGFTPGEFRDARIQRIVDRHSNGLIMPYLDIGDARDEGDFVRVNSSTGKGRYVEPGSTRGTTGDNSAICDCCGESVSEEDIYTVDDGDRSYCESCADAETFVCDYTGDRYRHRYGTAVHGSDSHITVHEDCLADAGFVLVTAGDERGEWWHESCVFTCEDCGEVFHEDARHPATDRCDDCEEARRSNMTPPEDLLALEAAGQLRLPVAGIAEGPCPEVAIIVEEIATGRRYPGRITEIDRDDPAAPFRVYWETLGRLFPEGTWFTRGGTAYTWAGEGWRVLNLPPFTPAVTAFALAA